MAVTQKQIAEEVGVTQQLVALALRDHPRVALKTREKIQGVAQRLGYTNQMNRTARTMAAKRHGRRVQTGIVAAILEPPGQREGESVAGVPYFMTLVDGVETQAGHLGLDLFLVPSRAGELPWLIRDGLVDGVILLGAHQSLRGLEELNLPLVTLGCEFRGVKAMVPDDSDGIRQAVTHLVKSGHKNIAYLGPNRWQAATARRTAFQNALCEYSLPVEENWIEDSAPQPIVEPGFQATKHLIERTRTARGALPFSAIVCHNDPLAMGACRALQEAGFRVPQDISVTGFDDVSLQYNASPSITSVGFARLEMGRRAVDFIKAQSDALQKQNGANAVAPEIDAKHELFPVQLVVRESTATAS